MSEVTIVLYAPPPTLLDAIRDKECFVTSSYGNSIEQRDAAHRRELTLKEELEFLTARHARVLAREETLENTICVMSEQNRYHEICCSKSNWGNDK